MKRRSAMLLNRVLPTGLFILAIASGMSAQDVDTLARARELHLAGKTRLAAELLDPWCANHPGDAGALWLSARNAYWRKNFSKALRQYRSAIAANPDDLYLRLDYIETQLGMGRFAASGNMLRELAQAQAHDPFFRVVQAKYHFWTGDWNAAETHALAARVAGSPEAPDLLRAIEAGKSPYMIFTGTDATDSQPLRRIDPVFEAGGYAEKWLDWGIRVSTPQFFTAGDQRKAALRGELSNRFRFPLTGTDLRVSAGIFKQQERPAEPVAALRLQQRLPHGLNLTLNAAQQPYLYTLASIDTMFCYRFIATNLEWNEPRGFQLQAGAQHDFFEDRNRIGAYWAWMLTPALRLRPFALRVGYAFSYADARENRFQPDKTLAELLADWNPDVVIDGSFAPYFTPEQMGVHSALALFEVKFSPAITLVLNGKYGFAAAAENPYFFVDGISGGGLFIRREFYTEDFTPLEFSARLSAPMGRQLSAEAHYAFTRNFFYENHTAGLRLKIIL